MFISLIDPFLIIGRYCCFTFIEYLDNPQRCFFIVGQEPLLDVQKSFTQSKVTSNNQCYPKILPDTLVCREDELDGEADRIVRCTLWFFDIIISFKSGKYCLITNLECSPKTTTQRYYPTTIAVCFPVGRDDHIGK